MDWKQKLVQLGNVLRQLLEERTSLCLIFFSGVYLAATLLEAAGRMFWYDELFTVYLCRYSTMEQVWSAVKAGRDLNPPLFYALTRLAQTLAGENHIGTRLPEMLGFWTMCLCIYAFVARRASAPQAFAAALFPLVTYAYHYAAEARPHGFVLGCCGAALLCWQLATEGQRRTLALVGLSLSLGAGMLSHCYAVLLLIPIAVGEAFRWLLRKKIDWPVCLAVLAPTPAILTYFSLLQRSEPLANTWAAPQGLKSVVYSYGFLLEPLFWPLLVAIVLVATHKSPARPLGQETRPSFLRYYPPHEMAALLTLAALPVFGVLLATVVTGVYTERYTLSSIVALGILLGLILHRHGDQRSPRMVVPAAALFLWFLAGLGWSFANRLYENGGLIADSASVRHRFKTLAESTDKELPVAVTDARLLPELLHYVPPDISSRLVYLWSNEAALKYLNLDFLERGLPSLREWWPLKMNIQEYQAFMVKNRKFLAYGPWGGRLDWLGDKLKDDGARLTFIGCDSETKCLQLVELGPRSEH